MHSFLEISLGNFWYLVAAASVVNVFVYRRAFAMRCENEDFAREAFGSFRWVALFGALLFLGLGVLQTVGGFVVHVFPFIIPTRGSWASGVCDRKNGDHCCCDRNDWNSMPACDSQRGGSDVIVETSAT